MLSDTLHTSAAVTTGQRVIEAAQQLGKVYRMFIPKSAGQGPPERRRIPEKR